jgi:hypothetical protein
MNEVSDARVEKLTAMVEQLQAEVAQLRARRDHPADARATKTDEPVDRRRMLKGAGLAAAAGAAALVVTGRAQPAGAIVPTLDLDTVNNATGNTTVQWTGTAGSTKIVFLVNDSSFDVSQSAFDAALAGWAGGSGDGQTTQVGVYGYSGSVGGIGMAGSGDIGVYAESFNKSAVLAEGSSTARGVIARSQTNQAIWSEITNVSNAHDSVRAETAGSGSGIYATSAKGAGGKFGGKTAQIQLVPSASSHPSSGSAGQFFVDSANRLWFCKGGTNWHQLA